MKNSTMRPLIDLSIRSKSKYKFILLELGLPSIGTPSLRSTAIGVEHACTPEFAKKTESHNLVPTGISVEDVLTE